MRQIHALAVLAAALAAPAIAQTVDRAACYQVKDHAKRRTSTLSVASAGVTQTCRVHVPATLACLGTDGTNTTGAFLCYPLHCPRPFPSPSPLTDEIGGQRVVAFRGARLLCAPATRTPTSSSTSSTTTPTVATTTTTAPSGACHFDDNDRTCRGTCGDGGHCSAVASGGACECRATPCGDASSPQCQGFCAPDEACIYLLTGCKCVSIP